PFGQHPEQRHQTTAGKTHSLDGLPGLVQQAARDERGFCQVGRDKIEIVGWQRAEKAIARNRDNLAAERKQARSAHEENPSVQSTGAVVATLSVMSRSTPNGLPTSRRDSPDPVPNPRSSRSPTVRRDACGRG